MIKILHIINSLDIGGNERYLLQLLEHLPREGFHQEVCVPDRGKDATRDLEHECHRLGIPVRVFRVLGNLDASALLKLQQIILKGRYDVVHTHLIYSQLYGRMAAISAKTKCIVSSEQNVYDFKRRPPFLWIERWLGKRTQRVVACSNKVRDHLIANVGLSPLKVVVVPNAVDTNLFFPVKPGSSLYPKVEDVRKELRLEPGDTVIGSVGHMSRQKGQRFLIDAIPRVLLRYPHAKFVFVGRGRLQRTLTDQARELGVEQAVRFAGIREDVPLVLNCFDLFVLPSLWEGFGTAIVEALACGVPVVASKVGGIPEIIEDGMNGILVPPGRSRPLAQAIIGSLDDPSLGRDMVYRGVRKVIETFSVGKMVETMARIYSQMLSRLTPPRQEISGWGDDAVVTSTVAWRA
jgi:glycosyltransferase involved in cell wall biosynthesis